MYNYLKGKGVGLTLICLLQIALAFLAAVFLTLYPPPASGQSPDSYIPTQAIVLLPLIVKEVKEHGVGLKEPEIIPAIFDHETCPGYKSKKCFSTTTELHTSRERGVGLGQLTKAWNDKGVLRFDNLTALKKKYPRQLGELDWDTFSSRADLQIRSTVLLFMEGYNSLSMITGTTNRRRMSTSAYNGGLADVVKARQRCKVAAPCNPQWWNDNVENHLPKSRKPIKMYGNRSTYDINRQYVREIDRRVTKYKVWFEKEF